MEQTFIQRCCRRADRTDAALVSFLSANGIHLLRWAMAIIYFWFGLLKLLDASPAGKLVVRTLSCRPPRTALMFVGGWEVLIGVGLMFSSRVMLRIVLLRRSWFFGMATLFYRSWKDNSPSRTSS